MSVMSELQGGRLSFTKVVMPFSLNALMCIAYHAVLCNFKVYYIKLLGLKWMVLVVLPFLAWSETMKLAITTV